MKLIQVTDPHVPPAGKTIYGVDNREPPCYAIFRIDRENVVIHQQRYTENWKTFPREDRPGA